MFSLNDIKPEFGSKKKSKRLGRGNGSGKGTYCGRGLNGQNSRAGGGVAPWFEGGQTPLFRRMPKLKGFKNSLFTVRYTAINISQLEVLASNGITEINKEVLLNHGVLRNKNDLVKILADGEITKKITLKADKISKSALEKITKAGGSVETK
ncbi:50S ribosomal protein L15 [Candidatus Gracilibacteria bacterium]|nr:50S ribosomal protein L15 [Candidatus Gracilibacteria bacterium]